MWLAYRFSESPSQSLIPDQILPSFNYNLQTDSLPSGMRPLHHSKSSSKSHFIFCMLFSIKHLYYLFILKVLPFLTCGFSIDFGTNNIEGVFFVI